MLGLSYGIAFMVSHLRSTLASTATQSNEDRSLASLLRAWLALNYWTFSDFASLTEGFCASTRRFTPESIADVVTGSRPDLMVREFRSFAEIEAGLAGHATNLLSIRTDADLVGSYTTSICIDDSARNASWWFALYCKEEWAWARVDKRYRSEVVGLTVIAKNCPAILRSYISGHKIDPVSHIRDRIQSLPSTLSLRTARFLDWALEYASLDHAETRLAIPLSMHIMTELGAELSAIQDLMLFNRGDEDSSN